jgi:hypothetical protein
MFTCCGKNGKDLGDGGSEGVGGKVKSGREAVEEREGRIYRGEHGKW